MSLYQQDNSVNSLPVRVVMPVLPESFMSGSLGQNARATGTDSVAIGESSFASGSASSAFGTDASATAKNSVALGDGSVANRANTVSIGKVNEERQLVNVADGTQSTDAVNKRQLDKVSTSVNGVSTTRSSACGTSRAPRTVASASRCNPSIPSAMHATVRPCSPSSTATRCAWAKRPRT